MWLFQFQDIIFLLIGWTYRIIGILVFFIQPTNCRKSSCEKPDIQGITANSLTSPLITNICHWLMATSCHQIFDSAWPTLWATFWVDLLLHISVIGGITTKYDLSIHIYNMALQSWNLNIECCFKTGDINVSKSEYWILLVECWILGYWNIWHICMQMLTLVSAPCTYTQGKYGRRLYCDHVTKCFVSKCVIEVASVHKLGQSCTEATWMTHLKTKHFSHMITIQAATILALCTCIQTATLNFYGRKDCAKCQKYIFLTIIGEAL